MIPEHVKFVHKMTGYFIERLKIVYLPCKLCGKSKVSRFRYQIR